MLNTISPHIIETYLNSKLLSIFLIVLCVLVVVETFELGKFGLFIVTLSRN